MKLTTITARDIPDLWFQAVSKILDEGSHHTIDHGSYSGQTRLEFDYFTGHITHPGIGNPLPEIPAHLGIPNPVDQDYIDAYMPYLMTAEKHPDEDYTYGQRLTETIDPLGNTFSQINYLIWCYKEKGVRNNQLIMQVGEPSDLCVNDPPCLRHIDTRIQDGALHFIIYFRSWDLWSGLPANLAGLQQLKSYMASEIGVSDGEMIVSSKGLHLYGYAEELAKIRCMK